MELQSYLKENWIKQQNTDLNEQEINDPLYQAEEELAESPAFFFDQDKFAARVKKVKEYLGENIPLTFSIKANPFLLNCLPETISHVEVCSPGELTICQKMAIAPEKIIYSGVMKERTDIRRAILYGVGILTAESLLHVKMENDIAEGMGRQKVILRLTSGNQFGMSEEDIEYIISHQDRFPNLEFYGIHYYSGTQKKKVKQIEKDMFHLTDFLSSLEEKYGYDPKLVEYGPGLATEYFKAPYDQTEYALLEEVSEILKGFAESFPLGIEMGRFLAAPCGTYVTQVKDLKYSNETNYVICDGGIHHLKYYGQTMAMQVPPIWVLPGIGERDGSVRGMRRAAYVDKSRVNDRKQSGAVAKERLTGSQEATEEQVLSVMDAVVDENDYCICGSLCTVADILVREAHLPALHVGDYLGFGRCGAYSVTEGSALFLSRKMPRIYLFSQKDGAKLMRDFVATDKLNMADPLKACLSGVSLWN